MLDTWGEVIGGLHGCDVLTRAQCMRSGFLTNDFVTNFFWGVLLHAVCLNGRKKRFVVWWEEGKDVGFTRRGRSFWERVV